MDPIREVAETIVNLGFATELELAPHIRSIRDRPVSESTTTDDSDAEELLSALESAGVLDDAKIQRVMKVLRGETTPKAPSPDKRDPFEGMVFGDFRALSKIGEGGMGAVYRAERQDDKSQAYVVKILSPLAADASTYVRFRREGEVMSVLRHPNVVRVFASGETMGLSYLAMEYIDGPTLQDIFERKGRFDWINAAKAVRQVVMGLEAAHAIGVIHRDVKPQNVLLSKSEGLLKVVDFGLAKVQSQPRDPNVSRAGDILGSPAYIAPEQWGDHDVDTRADLFAAGIILYQLLCGVLPFRGRSPAEYSKKILAGVYDPIELYNPEAPEGMRQIVARLLERRREHRYATAAHVVADLERVLRGEMPDVPRLVRQQGTTAERWVLLGRDQFVVGRAAPAHVALGHPSIVDRHATLERTSAGLILKEGEGKGAVRVNGMKVREITLKDGDVIEFGAAPPLKYRAGLGPAGLAPTPVTTPSPSSPLRTAPPGGAAPPPVSVPGAIFEGLVRKQSPQAVLVLVELLDETTWKRRTTRARHRLAAAGVATDVAARAAERAYSSYRRQAVGLAERLFLATHENLGNDPGAWLAWWFASGRGRFPPQVRPPGPRAQGAVALPGEGEAPQIVQLTGIERWVMGRENDCEIRISDRSVSRKHATLHRLLTRFAVKDEGSRFGTLLRGERRAVALLRHDDAIELGKAKVLLRQPEEPEPTNDETPRGVEGAVFDALVEMRSPHVTEALVAFVDPGRLLDGHRDARWPGQTEERAEDVLTPVLEERLQMALEALPAITKKNFGEDAEAWRRWWADEKARAPVQVCVEGWKELA